MAHVSVSLDPASFSVRRCPECGHPTYMHRNAGGPVNAGGPDSPVPCAAARYVGPGRVPGRGEYEFCRCTVVHPIREETR